MKKLRYLIEFIFIYLFVRLLQLLPIWLASNICGFLCKHILFFVGKFTNDNKKGLENISLVFPEISFSDKKKILKSSYENIGRFASEYINQHKMTHKWLNKNVTIIGGENFIKQIKEGSLVITAHFGNWEIIQRFLMLQDINLRVIYNPLQNPFINSLYLKQREVTQLPKGTNAMKQLLLLMKQKKSIGVVIDQRDKMGELFKFFNKDAKTSVAMQRLAMKYNYPMLPIKCERSSNDKNKFILTIYPILKTEKEDLNEGIIDLTNQSLRMLEDWIKSNPDNWLLWNYSRWRTKF